MNVANVFFVSLFITVVGWLILFATFFIGSFRGIIGDPINRSINTLFVVTIITNVALIASLVSGIIWIVQAFSGK